MSKQEIEKETIRKVLHYRSQMEDDADMCLGTSDSYMESLVDDILEAIPTNNYELTRPRHCPDCKKIVKTYWELLFCDKNPKGENTVAMGERHGNVKDGTIRCEDGYCNPQESICEPSEINQVYVDTHSVNQRCMECDQFLVVNWRIAPQ